MAVQAWLCTGGCAAVPSCFLTTCERHSGALAVVADGSSSLHVLDTSSRRHVTSVKLPGKAHHVSQLQSTAGPLPVAVCALSSGLIVSVPVDRALARAHSSVQTRQSSLQPHEDIFEALLGDLPDTAAGGPGVGGHWLERSGCSEEVVVDIASLPQHLNSVVSAAHVHGNKLLLFSRASETGKETLAVYTSGSSVSLDGCRVPTFSGAPVAQFTLSPALVDNLGHSGLSLEQSGVSLGQSDLSLGQVCLSRPPAFVIVQSVSRRGGVATSTAQFLTEDLFLQLFGPEYRLSSSPVAVFSSHRGCVYYCLLNTLTDPQSSGPRLLYNLEETVVAIHTLQLPRNPSLDKENQFLLAPREDPEGANTLLLVGQNGKIIASSVANSEQTSAHFTEFRVPGFVLSSLLAPGHSLLYSTLAGLRQVCLRPDCMVSSGATANSCGPILIPRIAFQFPNQISKFSSFLLSVSSDGQLPNKVVAMSLRGLVCTLTVTLPSDVTSPADSSLAAHGFESSLKAIEATSKQIKVVKHRLSSINSALTELSGALRLLLSVSAGRERGVPDFQSSLQQSDSRDTPISCSLIPMFESRDVTHTVPCIEVRLCYHGNKALGQGWSLVVHTLPAAPVAPSLSGLQESTPPHLLPVASRTVPLTGMAAGSSPFSVKVYPCASVLRPLAFSVCCSLHFDASRLQTALGQDASYTVLGQDRTHTRCMPKPVTSSSSGAACALCTRHFDALDFLRPLHCSSSALSPDVMGLRSQVSGRGSLPQPPVFLHHSLELAVPPVSPGLEGLLPPQLREQLATGEAEVRCRAYDGSLVSLREKKEEEELAVGKRLAIQTATRAMLAERLANDITALEGELSTLPYGDRERMVTIATEAFQLYCRLRTM